MRVLVIQTAHLGDLVLTTPLLRALNDGIPGLELVVLTTPLGGDLLGALPHVQRCFVFDKRHALRRARATVRLATRLRAERFDAVIAAQRSARSGLLARLCGAGRRIGFREAAGRWAYNETVPWDPAAHAVRRYLALAEPLLGPSPARGPVPELTLPAEARDSLAALVAGSGIAADERLICIAPGAAWRTKCWTPEGFSRVAAGAGALGLRPVLVGGASEVELCGRVARLSGVAPVQLAGRTSVLQLAALLARAAVFVGNDSGPAHVAAAVGTPVVSVFGPTVPRFGYAPFGEAHRLVQHPTLACRPCHRHGPHRCPLGHFRCMREVSATRVLQEVESVIRAQTALDPHTPIYNTSLSGADPQTRGL